MKKVFSSNKTCIRTGFRKTKNLKDLLVPSAFPDSERVESVSSDAMGCFRCNPKPVTIFYFQRILSKEWLQARAIKSDNHYLATQITSCIVPHVHSVITMCWFIS